MRLTLQSGLLRRPQCEGVRSFLGYRRLLRPHAVPGGQLKAGMSVRAVLATTVTAPQQNTAYSVPAIGLEANAAGGSPAAGPSGRPPADIDRERFQLHWSVDMWRDFWPSRWLESIQNGEAPTTERLRRFTETLRDAVSTAGIFGSTEAARYWAYHLTRSGFFMVQGLASILAARTAVGNEDAGTTGYLTRLQNVFRGGWAGPVGDAMLTFYQDHELIKEGKYGEPWDMTTSGHRQFNPLFILQRSANFLNEAVATLRRREKGQAEDVWLKSALLPDYYQNTFHYQTDGWLSARSASVYETSTETLFVGRQDAMQRTTLVHISDFMAGKSTAGMRALEVAAGTGRFATFFKDNYPSLHLTVSDLSPFYLAEARRNLNYWKRMRAPNAELGGTEGTGCDFLQTPGEAIDAPDNSFDIVYCIYLFHELPSDVRKQVAREMARVCRPGGLVVLTDSAQFGDRRAYDATLGNFQNFNEPYYGDYLRCDLGALFEEAGLRCGSKVVASSTKSLSFYKPLPQTEEQEVQTQPVAAPIEAMTAVPIKVQAAAEPEKTPEP